MTDPRTELRGLRPKLRDRVIDLVADAGVDVRDWSNYNGANASTNPKYCYEWAFVEEGKVVVLNLWYSHLRVRKGKIIADFEPHGDEDRASRPAWTARKRKFRAALATAWEDRLPIRVILLDGEVRRGWSADDKASTVERRELDPASWAVTSFDGGTGAVTITRGAIPRGVRGLSADPAAESRYPDEVPDSQEYREGGRKSVWISAIERDRDARRACLRHHGYRCAACDLLFSERYGDIGENYIHVHHIRPLSTRTRERKTVPERDLVPVCPNCHAMLHRTPRPMTVWALRRTMALAARKQAQRSPR